MIWKRDSHHKRVIVERKRGHVRQDLNTWAFFSWKEVRVETAGPGEEKLIIMTKRHPPL